jgi:hypothetical protein
MAQVADAVVTDSLLPNHGNKSTPPHPTPSAEPKGTDGESATPAFSVEDLEPAGRVKRRRRQPVTKKEDDTDDLDKEQLKILQQAIDNSRAENVPVTENIEEAPVFYPSIEEFKDPIKVIIPRPLSPKVPLNYSPLLLFSYPTLS